MKLISDEKLKKNRYRYLFQCGIAGIAIFLILAAMNAAGHNKAVAASLGSSAFIVFASPRSYSARLRSVIGGNIAGILTGALLTVILALSPFSSSPDWTAPRMVAGALAVALSMFVMSITDTEHPPASGLALGMVLSSWYWSNLLVIIAAVAFLSGVRRFFSSRLLDLY